MMALKRLWGPNKLARSRMAAAHSGYSAIATKVRVAQHKYLVGPRAPNLLKPIGIDESTANWIREKYKTAPKSLSLGWIDSLRDNHRLVSCPMCGGTAVATIEHVLPKDYYPEFAVLSFNLVPCCDGCQRRRSAKGKKYQFIHPYFDHSILHALRLAVKFIPPYDSVVFQMEPQYVTGADLDRVQKHLDESVPPRLFKRHMDSLWGLWHKRCHKGDIQSRLKGDLVDAEEIAQNSWDAAFLRGLLLDSSAIAWMQATPPGSKK